MLLAMTANERRRPRSVPWRRILFAATFTLVLQCLIGFIVFLLYASQPDIQPLSSAMAQEISLPSLEQVDDSAWQPLELPDKICRRECQSHFKAYRLSLGGIPEKKGQALYVRSFDGAMAAYINGEKIGQTGSMQAPVADMTYHPAFFDIPEALLSETANTLDIVVASLVPEGGRLTAPFVADRELLHRSFTVANALTIDSLAIINGILGVFLFISVLLFFAANRDYLFVWFGLLLFFSIFRNLNVLLPEWPADTIMRNGIYLCSTLGVLLASGGLVSRLAAKSTSRFDFFLVASWIPASLLIFVGLNTDMWAAWGISITLMRLLTLTLGVWLLLRFLIYSARLPPIVQGSVFALLGAALSLMLHDTFGSLPPRLLLFQLSNLAALPIILSFCVVLAYRYRDQLTRINQQNTLLKSAVAEKEAELAVSYAELGRARDAEVLADERQRIMEDMHDGVGGRLATLLQRIRLVPGGDDNLARELQNSLNDLRLIIDSLDSVTGSNFGYALGTFRQRIEPWLADNDINLSWQMDLEHEPGPGPARTLQIYRILQEALNNVIRHANARQVHIHVAACGAGISIAVADDGMGLSSQRRHGRGLGYYESAGKVARRPDEYRLDASRSHPQFYDTGKHPVIMGVDIGAETRIVRPMAVINGLNS